MGLFEKVFGKREPNLKHDTTFQTMTAYRPVYTTWNGKLYESELVRSAIGARANHISKLKVDITGTARPLLRTILKNRPNDWQTWGQFLYRTSTILDMQNTAFIVPVLDGDDVRGVFTVLPSQCELVEYNGVLYIKYRFQNGKTACVEFDRCGVLTKFQYEDDFFGSDNNALNSTMRLINMQNQGITEAIKNSGTFRFMARLTNFTKPEDLAKEQRRFNRENLSAENSGILLLPNTMSDIKELHSTPYVVDTAQMEQIQRNVFNYFGVNEDILQCKAIGDTLDGFFDGAIEPFSIQLSDVLTKMIYTNREVSTGNRVDVVANRLQYMSVSNKVNMAKELGDRGVLMIDEIRELFNLAPLPDGVGQHSPIRGEYYMVDQGKEGSWQKDAQEQPARV